MLLLWQVVFLNVWSQPTVPLELLGYQLLLIGYQPASRNRNYQDSGIENLFPQG